MIEKEIAELRRTLRPEKNAVTAIHGCYINTEGRVITTFSRSLGLIEVSEAEKYFALFRKSLSGALHKNLIDVGFSSAHADESEEVKLLHDLTASELNNEELLTRFYEKVASSVKREENYVLLLLHNNYDTLFRTSDGESDDSRYETFSYMQCLLCPVKAGKSTLTYLPEERAFGASPINFTVCPPQSGFLYPAFDGRRANIYGALLYTSSDEDNHEDFDRAVFGETSLPMPAAEQKRSFKTVLASSLEEDCSFDVAKQVHCQICDRIEIHKESKDPEPLLLSKTEVKEVLESCGVAQEKLESFSKNYNESFGAATDLSPKNIVSPSRFEVRTPNVVIKVAKGHEDQVITRVIDGRKYVLVAADEGVELNGLAVTVD